MPLAAVAESVPTMQLLIRRLSQFAYAGNTFVARWRAVRMEAFQNLVRPPAKARIIDLGGTTHMWKLVPHDYHVTLVNLPGSYSEEERRTRPDNVEFIEGDACDLGARFQDGAFDVVFSNSVIEHVGDHPRRAAFAREVKRLGRAYWIQTPSDRFPIEAHTGVPYYFRLPEFAREALVARWEKKLPAWTEFIRGTCVVSRAEMQELFPRSELYLERKLLLEKSYAVYRPFA